MRSPNTSKSSILISFLLPPSMLNVFLPLRVCLSAG